MNALTTFHGRVTVAGGLTSGGIINAAPGLTEGFSTNKLVNFTAGTYLLSSAPTIPAGGVTNFEPGVTITGASSGTYGITSGADFIGWLNPDTQTDNGTYYLHLSGHLKQRRMTKRASGAPLGTGSDQHYAADFIQTDDDIVQPNVGDWYFVNAVGRQDLLVRGLNAPVRGTGIAHSAEVYVLDTATALPTAANPSGESEGFNHTLVAVPGRANAGHNWWGGEINVLGSAAGSSRSIVGLSVVVQNPATLAVRNAATDYRGAVGQAIITAPGSGVLPFRYGASWAGLTTRPFNRGMTIGGLSGAYDGASRVLTGNETFADYGFEVGLDIGGNFGAWPYQRPGEPALGYWQSKIKEGQYIQRYTHVGLKIFAAHPSFDPSVRSLLIMNDAGPAEIQTQVLLTGLPTSATGLPSGSLWRDVAAANVIKMVP